MARNVFKLTPREKEIYTLLLAGLSIKDIAQKLCIATCTACIHKQSILEKKRVNSVTKLLAARISELEAELKKVEVVKDFELFAARISELNNYKWRD